MKTLLLAALVAAGLACSASTADAQFRARRSATYYSYPTYSSPYSYAVPSYYNGGVVTSSYTPATTNTGVVVTNGTAIYSNGTYYDPYVLNTYPGYSYPAYYGNSYYGNSYYGNSYGGWRGRRW